METLRELHTRYNFDFIRRNEIEMQAALRLLLGRGGHFQDAEIIVAGDDLLPLCFEITRLYSIPCTFDPGVPLHYSKAARTVASWLRWLSRDYNGHHLIRMMYDGIPAPQEVQHEGMRGGRLQMAAMLRRVEISHGREHLLAAVIRYVEKLEANADSSESTRHGWRQAVANRKWLEMLFDITPNHGNDGLFSLQAITAGALALVQKLCRDAYPGEALALTRLGELMTQILRSPDIRIGAEDAAQRILKLIHETHYPMVLQSPGSDAIPTTDPLPGHLHISTLSRGGFSGRRITFILGFDAGFEEDSRIRTLLTRCQGEVIRTPGSDTEMPPLSLSDWWLGLCEKGDPEQIRSAILACYPLHREGAHAIADRTDFPPQSIPELFHLLNILRVLIDPENPSPVVAFLRGPFCGADDRALSAYELAGGKFAFNTRSIPGTDERITLGLQFLKDTVRLVRSNPPGTVIASVVDRLALPAVIATSPSGWTGVAALRNVLTLVRHWSMYGLSIPEIVEKLGESPIISAPLSWHAQTATPDAMHQGKNADIGLGAEHMSSGELVDAAATAEADIRSRFEHASRISEP
jgi:hypothetical protein